MSITLRPEAVAVASDLLVSVLAPYKEHCKYLKKVFIVGEGAAESNGGDSHAASGLITAKGEFSIPSSCYIDDTGHFNSVEFHICYNQFIYVLLAYCVENRLLSAMQDMDLEEYKRQQLPNILLVQFSTTFKRPIRNPDHFHGRLTIKRAVVRGKTIYIKTHCVFFDNNNGFSEGDMLLAIVDDASN